MRRALCLFSVVLPFTALAQAPTDAGPSATPDAGPMEAVKPDPLKEANDLIEVQANTRANLEKAIEIYETALKDPALPQLARIKALVDEARAYQRLGDLQKGDDTKIKTYEKGRAAAGKAIALDPRYADAYFWDSANQALIGQTKGIMNSLFMLPDLRRSLNRALELDPSHLFARQTLGQIDHAVPGLVGGSDDRAEKTWLDVMKRDPRFTPTMVHLAKFYRDKGDKAEARKWAQKVLDAKSSSAPNDWKKFDKAEARAVLRELGE